MFYDTEISLQPISTQLNPCVRVFFLSFLLFAGLKSFIVRKLHDVSERWMDEGTSELSEFDESDEKCARNLFHFSSIFIITRCRIFHGMEIFFSAREHLAFGWLRLSWDAVREIFSTWFRESQRTHETIETSNFRISSRFTIRTNSKLEFNFINFWIFNILLWSAKKNSISIFLWRFWDSQRYFRYFSLPEPRLRHMRSWQPRKLNYEKWVKIIFYCHFECN